MADRATGAAHARHQGLQADINENTVERVASRSIPGASLSTVKADQGVVFAGDSDPEQGTILPGFALWRQRNTLVQALSCNGPREGVSRH
jgi:hypothetical protein